MKEEKITCDHACKNTCSMLNEALRKEASNVKFYEELVEDCSLPEVRNFVNSIIDERRKQILEIIKKLNEIHAKSNIVDGINSSFNNTDG